MLLRAPALWASVFILRSWTYSAELLGGESCLGLTSVGWPVCFRLSLGSFPGPVGESRPSEVSSPVNEFSWVLQLGPGAGGPSGLAVLFVPSCLCSMSYAALDAAGQVLMRSNRLRAASFYPGLLGSPCSPHCLRPCFGWDYAQNHVFEVLLPPCECLGCPQLGWSHVSGCPPTPRHHFFLTFIVCLLYATCALIYWLQLICVLQKFYNGQRSWVCLPSSLNREGLEPGFGSSILSPESAISCSGHLSGEPGPGEAVVLLLLLLG